MAEGYNLGTAWIQISPSMRGISSGIQRELGAVNIDKATSSWSGSVTGAFSGAFKTVQTMAATTFAAVGAVIATNLNGASKRADTLNNFPKIMKNLGYTSEDASKSMSKMVKSLDGLPTTLDSMTGMVTQLAPLTGGLDKATDISLAFNNALLAGGKSTALQTNAMEQYAQMLSVGKVDMAAWRSMVTAMPGQMNQLSTALLGTGSNAMDLYAAMQDGTISFDDFNQAVVNLNTNGIDGFVSFSQQAKDATQGIGTAVENAKNRIVKALSSILEAIGVDNISSTINALTSGIVGFGNKVAGVIDSMQASGGFSGLGSTLLGLSPIIGGVLGALGSLATQIPIIGGLFSGLTGPVGIVIGLFASIMTHSELLQHTLGAAFQTIGAALSSDTVQGALSSLSQSLTTVATQLGGALAVAVAAIAPIIADMAVTVLPAIANTIGMVATALAPIAGTVIRAIADVLTAVLPILAQMATAILPVLGNMIQVVATALAPIIEQIAGILVQALTSIMPIIMQVVTAILPVVVQLISSLVPVIGQLITAILPVLVSILDAVIPVLSEIITAVLPVLIPLVMSIISVVLQVIQIVSAILVPVIQVAGSIISVVVQAISAVFMWLWTNGVSPVVGWVTDKLQALSTWMSGTLAPAISTVIDGVKSVFQSVSDKASDIGEAVKNAFTNMTDGVKTAWDGIKSAAATPVNFLINTVYRDGIKKLADDLLDKLGLDLSLPTISAIPGYATGGVVLPGYTPGRDVYHFVSPDGGGALALSGGEAIMRPEWVRAVGGPSAINAMNAAARSHPRRIPGGDRGVDFPAFADGGIWNRVKDAVGSSVSAATDWIGDAADAVASVIQDPIGAVANLIKTPVQALVNQIPGEGFIADAARALPGKWIDGFADFLKGKTSSMAS